MAQSRIGCGFPDFLRDTVFRPISEGQPVRSLRGNRFVAGDFTAGVSPAGVADPPPACPLLMGVYRSGM